MSRGLMIPSNWYVWPDECDPAYQAKLEQWRRDYTIGNDYPMPIQKLNRNVFLPENMPPELRGKDVEALQTAGVRMVSGKVAADFIIEWYETMADTKLSDSGAIDFLHGYLLGIGIHPE